MNRSLTDPLVEIRHVTHRFGRRTVLQDVSFSLFRGEVFGLLGPNGAGKSTLLSLLSTLYRPVAGDLLYAGESILSRPAAIRSHMGYVPQELALHTTLSAIDNLRFWAGVYGLSGAAREQAARAALVQMGLQERAADRVDTWSGGMKRRLNLAAALMHQPDLLVLDEPTAGVDAGSRQTISAMIRAVQAQGRAVLLTSHDTDELAAVCDRVGLLHQGCLLAVGRVSEVLADTGYPSLEACLLGLEAGA